ncbi:P-selectin-like [Clavelina lepadiformis]|uniref:P-selectin-like n=1 Tax=Clavelina lepadiformis TaxID=159417 RepID=UPI004042C812
MVSLYIGGLLLGLFIVACTAEIDFYENHCRRLRPPALGSLSPAKRFYNVDDEVFFKCRYNYFVDGPESIFCLPGGEWTETPPNCVLRCPRPTKPKHGGFTPEQANYEIGAKVTFFCTNDNSPSESHTLTCMESGQWSGKEPSCDGTVGDSCVTPPTPAFGDFQPGLDLYTMGTRIHYFCPQPYQLRGERELVCFPNGKWSYPFPTCGPPRCLRPDSPDHGSFGPDQTIYKPGATIWFQCDHPYVIEGDKDFACLQNGYWSGYFPTCKAQCSKPKQPTRGSIFLSKSTYEVGEEVHFSCRINYRLKGAKTIICLSDGTWSNEEPICEAPDCRPLVRPKHGTFGPNLPSYPQGTSVWFGCEFSYVLKGVKDIVCQEGGFWSNSEPTCFRRQCSRPRYIKNGVFSPSQSYYVPGLRLRFSCDQGYYVKGRATIYCKENGEWSHVFPTCQLGCRPPIRPVNGYFGPVLTTYPVGKPVWYACEAGYSVEGEKDISCLENGEWSSPVVKCVSVYSCRGKCSQFTTSWPCQCDGRCINRGNCCGDYVAQCFRPIPTYKFL